MEQRQTLTNITTGASNDTITLTGLTAAAANAINGGAGTGDVLNASITNAATDFTNVSNIETINLTVGANTQAGFDDGTKDDGLNAATTINILGGNSLSTMVAPVVYLMMQQLRWTHRRSVEP